jgi:hypothetical protein
VCREYFSIIFNVKKCALHSIKYDRFANIISGCKDMPGTNTLTYLLGTSVKKKKRFLNIDNRTARNTHLCMKTTVISCHRCLINTGVEKTINI